MLGLAGETGLARETSMPYMPLIFPLRCIKTQVVLVKVTVVTLTPSCIISIFLIFSLCQTLV